MVGRRRVVAEAKYNGRQDHKSTYAEAWKSDPVADFGHFDSGHDATGDRETPAHETDKDQNRTNNPQYLKE